MSMTRSLELLEALIARASSKPAPQVDSPTVKIVVDGERPELSILVGERVVQKTTVPASRASVAGKSNVDAAKKQSDEEDPATHCNLVEKLTNCGVEYSQTTHRAVRTSEEAAAVRGVDPASGAKAMLLAVKPGDPFILAVISATQKMDSKKMKKVAHAKSLRFASEEEVWQVTGCRPGAVPPFGSLWGLTTYVDSSLQEQGETINFNAGLRTHSIRLSFVAYKTAEQPTVAEFRTAM